MMLNEKIRNLRVIEYSPSQKCFHVESVAEMLQCNLRVFRGQTLTDYLPIAVFEDYEEVYAFLKKAHEILDSKLKDPLRVSSEE
jgi:hypothetical protein